MKAANAPFLARSHRRRMLEHLKGVRKGRQGAMLNGRASSVASALPGSDRQVWLNAMSLRVVGQTEPTAAIGYEMARRPRPDEAP